MLYLYAVGLGALHAFEPGHGKTLIAAYMVGTRGRAVDGLLLGLVVTFTHTFSVILLGVIATILSKSYSEQDLHAWLGLFSAIIILIVGIWMLKTRLSPGSGHGHRHLLQKSSDHHSPEDISDHHHHHDHQPSHPDDHGHHHPHEHPHHHAHSPHRGETENTGLGNLLLLGISGGLVPCPAAIAALLAAIGTGRSTQGLMMTIFFSIGLGGVMMTIGVILSQAGKLTLKISESQEFARRLGILSAVLITLLGLYTLVHSLRNILS